MEKKRAILFVGIVYVLDILCALPLFVFSGVLDQQGFVPQDRTALKGDV